MSILHNQHASVFPPHFMPHDVYMEIEHKFGYDKHKMHTFINKIQDLSTQYEELKDEPTKTTSWGSSTNQDLTFIQLMAQQGLSTQQHTVTTPDGYELTLFRVQDKTKYKSGAPVVFVQHGLFSDANFWALNADKSLSVQLAKQGYDVWFGNNRGNRYSRKNNHLDPENDQAKFFDYSFYELGKYDAPTQIDYVRSQTGKDKLHYIGHSQGTSQMFSALSNNHGNLNDKIDLFVSLAPIVNLANSSNGLFQNLAGAWRLHQWATSLLHVYEIRDPNLDQHTRDFCNEFGTLCDELYKFLNVRSPFGDEKAMDLMLSEAASSGSVKQILHYAQQMSVFPTKYRQYDYGTNAANVERYGKNAIIPAIQLDKISQDIPMYFFAGQQDDLADPTDVQWLVGKMGSRVKNMKVINNFDHNCFAVGKDMGWTEDVIQIINQHNFLRAPQILPKLYKPSYSTLNSSRLYTRNLMLY